MYILCIYFLFRVQRDLIFISIGFNLIMIRPNYVYFMYISSIRVLRYLIFISIRFNLVMIRLYHIYIYILSISGSKRFNFHYIITNTYIIFGFNLVMIRPNHVYFMYILSISLCNFWI